MEFDRELAEVRDELHRSPDPAGAGNTQPRDVALGEELARLAEVSPEAAVTTAFSQIEARLVELLDEAGAPSYSAVGGVALARLARRHELISSETVSAIEGLAVMRNLAVNSPGGDIGGKRAREYLALADAVLYTMSQKPADTTASRPLLGQQAD